MQILMQLAMIFLICWIGEIIASWLPFTFPASVISLILVFLILLSGKLKVFHIKKYADFLLTNMAFFFIPSAVSILDHFTDLEGRLPVLLFICLVSIFTTFAITSYTVSAVIHWEAKWKGRRNHGGT